MCCSAYPPALLALLPGNGVAGRRVQPGVARLKVKDGVLILVVIVQEKHVVADLKVWNGRAREACVTVQ